MMGEIKTFTRTRLLDLFYSVYEKDAKKVILLLSLTKERERDKKLTKCFFTGHAKSYRS